MARTIPDYEFERSALPEFENSGEDSEERLWHLSSSGDDGNGIDLIGVPYRAFVPYRNDVNAVRMLQSPGTTNLNDVRLLTSAASTLRNPRR
jgi:hypothetical protein